MEGLVSQIKNKHGTTDPFVLADALDIIVKYDPLGSFHGYYMCDSGIKVVCLNSDDTDEVQRYTLAHEIGHFLLHGEANFFALRDSLFASGWQERQADKFAIHLLLPDEVLKENPQYSIDNWATVLGIDRKLVELRF